MKIMHIYSPHFHLISLLIMCFSLTSAREWSNFALIHPTVSMKSELKNRNSRNLNENEIKKMSSRVGLTPPMGWNSWYHFGCNINEKIILEIADAMVSSGLIHLGYEYLNIDDCWSDFNRNSSGFLVANPTTFPRGIAFLADYVHKKGLKLGIYSDAGFFTCARRPGSLGYEEKDALTFASWGVDYLKYDNCFNDMTPPIQRFSRMQRALNATNRKMFYSICEWGIDNPAEWAPMIGNSWRTTPDISDDWEIMLRIADYNNLWASSATPGAWNDPDVLEVGNGGMTYSQYKTHFSLWAIMKSPLLLSCDIRKLSNETKSLITNKEVIAVNQDGLGIQGILTNKNGALEVWSGSLAGGRKVVLFLNRGSPSSSPSLLSVVWKSIGLDSKTRVKVRDVWLLHDLDGLYSRNFSTLVNSHDVKMYVFTPQT